MATTGIWKIEKRLDHVINYIVNTEKTSKSESYKELHNLSDYDELEYITEASCYVSGLNCSPETAYKEMMFTKEQYNKKDKILGYHSFQSFKEGEITAEKAHLIGLKLAEELWDDYEVVVATHINTNHIHNHFVINSVSFKDGKKYHDCNETYAILRQTSDALCEEYGLSVLNDKDCKKGKVNYSNYYEGYVNKNNYYTTSKQDIDKAIKMAYSYSDFLNIIRKMGYEVNNRYGKLSVRKSPYRKNIRIARAFGSDYEIESIENRIKTETQPRIPFIGVEEQKNRVKVFEQHKKLKSHGIYGLYKYYCYLLKIYPKHYPEKVLSPALRVEATKLDQISKQTMFLVDKKIETYEQLIFYKDNLKSKIQEFCTQKHNLWIKHNRTENEEEKINIRKKIDEISNQLSIARKELILCDGVIDRLDVVKENIKEFENEKGKEKKKDEL